MKKSRLIPLLSGTTALAAAVAIGAAFATSGTPSHKVATTAAHSAIPADQVVTGALNATAPLSASAKSAEDAVAAFWTPERMRTAKPADLTTNGSSSAAGPAVVDKGAVQSVAPAAPQGQPLAAGGVKAVGKVFFTEGNSRFVCSGSVIRSGRKNVVSTAGHCVIDAGANHFHTNWIFRPDFKNERWPYGTWVGAIARTTVGWARNGNFDYDAAFVNVHDLHGRKLQNVVGGEGLVVNQGYRPNVTILGYPQAPPFTGETQKTCRGRGHRFHNFHEVEVACNFTGGASGGPWLGSFRNGFGYVDGISSNKNTNNNKDIRSPYFATWTWNLYKSAA